MSLTKLNKTLLNELEQLKKDGRAKNPERIISDYKEASAEKGPRYLIEGYGEKEFIRMNSNSYLSLSNHHQMIKAADEATHKFGVGPGAVRFIDGTFSYHLELEKKVAAFVKKENAKIFNSAYTSNLALALTLSSDDSYWIGDELNHNSIIRSMRISNVQRENRAIYKHNNVDDLRRCLDSVPKSMKRVFIIYDGIFSMRGDFAPQDKIQEITEEYSDRFQDGVISIVDDSHGIAAYGKTGRGTSDFTNSEADICRWHIWKSFWC
jgi:glycine C-acetyltransferase